MRSHARLSFIAAAALALALALAPFAAQARLGGGFSFGSRGGRTFSYPSFTHTAPGGAAPIGRSMTSPGAGYGQPGYRSGYGYGYGSGGLFGRGFFGGLLGAGLFGLFFGRGLFGGLGGPGSLLGLLLQIGLVIFLVKLALRWFAGAQPGFAGRPFGGAPAPYGAGPGYAPYSPAGYGAAGAGAGQAFAPTGADFNAFERLLQESQTDFGAEDLDRLRAISTPEMGSYFAEQIAQNARRGLTNKIADVRLLKGDLSEAWREPSGEYATVAMRFSLLDWTVERDSGRLVEGDPRTPREATEIWTFRRELGSGPQGWRISAIQQAQP